MGKAGLAVGGRRADGAAPEQGCVPVECRQGLTASPRRKEYCNIISNVVLKTEN